MQITAERGAPERLGPTLAADGAHVAVWSDSAERIELCLFDANGATETARLALPGRDGGLHFGFVPGLGAGARYGLRAHGPFDPARGHRFDPAKLLVDPYARQLDRPFRFDPALCRPPSQATDTAALVPKAVVVNLARDAKPLPFAPPGFTYELHVKAFTARRADMPKALRGTLAALGRPKVLDHIQRLGVDTVELMPVAAWLDEAHLGALGLTNAWGYNPITHLALDPRLAPNGLADLRRAVDALHRRGLRVLLDVVFNHSGEGDAAGPVVSYRGLDNALYYRHAPDGALVNDTGCGNTFACDREPVMRLVLDTLRDAVEIAGVDGFRYDLAPVLGRVGEGGFDRQAPLLRAIAADPVLKDRIHVAESWDIGPGGYQVGKFPPPFVEWHDRFRDDVRRFWRGDAGLIGALATRLAGSADLFGGREGPSVGLNFVAAHDGFTLRDLVSFAEKHNEANGEENRDGHNDNHSWNNGAEGATDDPAVIEARGRDVRALLATLFVSRGNPMLVAGDEFGRTQGGNNNAYCQDGPLLWLDWGSADTGLAAFTARLAALRRRHPALRADRFLSGAALGRGGTPDVAWLRADGTAMTDGDWHDEGRRFLGVALGDPDEGGRAIVFLNAGHEAVTAVLPPPRAGFGLALDLQSDAPDLPGRPLDPAASLAISARAVFVVTEAPLA